MGTCSEGIIHDYRHPIGRRARQQATSYPRFGVNSGFPGRGESFSFGNVECSRRYCSVDATNGAADSKRSSKKPYLKTQTVAVDRWKDTAPMVDATIVLIAGIYYDGGRSSARPVSHESRHEDAVRRRSCAVYQRPPSPD